MRAEGRTDGWTGWTQMTKLIVTFSSCLKATKTIGEAELRFVRLLNKAEMTNFLKHPVLFTERLLSPIAFHVDPQHYVDFTTEFSLL
jgi:hypothetical protein